MATSFAAKKMRVVHQRAGRGATEWRSVGSITILGPDLKTPVYIDRAGYIVRIYEAENADELRKAVVRLRSLNRWSEWDLALYVFLGSVIGYVLGRSGMML